MVRERLKLRSVKSNPPTRGLSLCWRLEKLPRLVSCTKLHEGAFALQVTTFGFVHKDAPTALGIDRVTNGLAVIESMALQDSS